MSGLFGIVDPEGVDGRLVDRALAATPFRGSPRSHVDGRFAVGGYATSPDDRDFLRIGKGHALAADARIDGTVPGTRLSWRTKQSRGIELLEEALLVLGPEELIGVAGDYSVVLADTGRQRMVVARDAFGTRPIFWASRGRAHAFASDVEILRALGFGSDALVPEVITAFLARNDVEDGRTAFEGVRILRAGHWVEVGVSGTATEHRWFIPERLSAPDLGRDEAVRAVRETIVAATADRAR